MFFEKKSFSAKVDLLTIVCCILLALPTLSARAHSGGEVTSKKN